MSSLEHSSRLGSLFAVFAVALFATHSLNLIAAERQSLDHDWRFHRGDVEGAEVATFDASAWRALDLPHDASIELPTAATAPSGGAGGFFQTGISWYRRTLMVPASWSGKKVAVEFEGASANTDVWINGVHLGSHRYSFTPFEFDLTPHLKLGADNTVSVRVDTSLQPNARWYAGSGIYRHVWLRLADPVHVAPRSLFVNTSTLTEKASTVQVHATVRNESAVATGIRVETVIIAPEGRTVATNVVESSITAGGEFAITPELAIERPRAWSPETPVLYRAVVRVFAEKRLLDEAKTSFGIRTVRVTAERGFELNGAPLKLCGGNVHHDLGPLGAASFDRAEERKVALLKAAGFNAVRTSHNPPSVAFLDVCDRAGLLVMDEAFDGWAKAKNPYDYHLVFETSWQQDLDAMVLRDRNHPAVVLWSIGNEMNERGNAEGQRIAHMLASRIRELDASRPVTAGVNGLGEKGDWTKLDPLFAALDIAGYNYELSRHATDHARVPTRAIVSTESYQSEAFANWAIAHDNPYVLGDFVWSAMDYLGEAGIGRVFPPDQPAVKHWEGNHFPWHGGYCGDIDLIGWRKPVSHYRKIVWDAGERLYMAVVIPAPGGKPWTLSPWSMSPSLPSWTWPDHVGAPLTVEVYSHYDAVSLSLNGKELGQKPTTRAEEFKAIFTVPYAAGVLKATGLRDGRAMETFTLKTAGPASVLRLTVDRSTVNAGGADLAFVTAEILDRAGVPHMGAVPLVRYEISGPGSIAGIGSGDLATEESYQANPRHLFQGRGLLVIRSGKSAGKIKLKATADGLPAAEITITVVAGR